MVMLCQKVFSLVLTWLSNILKQNWYETIYKKYPDLKEYLETHGFGIISHYENLEEKYSLIRKYFQELAENYIYACLSIEHQTKHIGSFTTIYSNKNLSELKERINKEQK